MGCYKKPIFKTAIIGSPIPSFFRTAGPALNYSVRLNGMASAGGARSSSPMAPAEHAPDQQTRNSERTDVANRRNAGIRRTTCNPFTAKLAHAAAILGW